LNILENLYTIESSSDLLILKLGLYLSLAFAIPFLALLFTSTRFSIIHFKKAKSLQNDDYLAFSKFLSEIVTKFWFRFLFGVLPMFGAVFFYTQLYAKQIPGAAGNLLLAFILFMVGLCLIVFSKSVFTSEKIEEITNTFPMKVSCIGTFLVLFASFILLAYLQLPISRGGDSFLQVLFSANSIMYLLLFISLAFGLTSAVIVAKLNRSTQKNYTDYGRSFATQTGMIFSFLHPLLYVLIILSTPVQGLSFMYFGAATIVLLLMLFGSIQFYAGFKEKDSRSTSIVLVFVLIISVMIYSSQVASETAAKKEIIQKGEVELFS